MKNFFSSYWIRSAFYSILQRFSFTLFGLINFMLLIRWLTKPEMGSWALFLAVISIFEATKSGLLKNAHIRYVSSSDDVTERTEIASSSFIINTLITLLFIIFLLFFSDWMSSKLHAGKDLSDMLKWFTPGLLCMIFFSHLEATQQSHLDFKGVFAGYIVRQMSFFIFILINIIFHIPFSLKHLAIYQSISVFLGAVSLFMFSRKYLLFRFEATFLWVKRIVGYGGYIFGSGIMSNIFSNLDQIMTGTFLTSSAVASYNSASRINQLVDIPSYAAAEILFPKSSKAAAEEGNERVKYLFEKMVGILLSFTTPAAIFIILFPGFVINIIAGAQYKDAAPILQLYMIIGLLRPMQNQAANLLNSIGKPGLCFLINTISLGANLLINYICLSSFGFYGAAIGTLITSMLGATAWYFIMRKQIGMQLTKIAAYMVLFYKESYFNVKNFLKKEREINSLE